MTNQDDEFPIINTGNGFQNDLIATTNDRLKKSVIATRELSDGIKQLQIGIFGIDGLLTDVIDEIKIFKKTIKSLDAKNETLQKRIYYLTWATVALSVVTVISSIIKYWPVHK